MTPGNSSGGGIVRGGPSLAATSSIEGMRALRRRWPTGVAIVTIAWDGGFRGATVSSFLPLSVDPPVVAIGLERDAGFQHLMQTGVRFAVSVLDWKQEFLSERFAGRAPVPDKAFSGVPHHLTESGLPVIDGCLGACVGEVSDRIDTGDHLLVVGKMISAEMFPDSDDPLLVYDGRYRSLEIS